MPEEPAVAQVMEVAASAAPLLERARAVVETLDRWLPVTTVWLTLCDPQLHAYAAVGRSGLEKVVHDYLDEPTVSERTRLDVLMLDPRPICVTELPVPAGGLPTWADCTIPAGFREGVEIPLFEPGGTYLGTLSMLFSSADPTAVSIHDDLSRLEPLIACAVSPMRSVAASARLVQGATSGAVLFRDGSTCPLPGLPEHELVARDSLIARMARHSLLAGHVYRSFMWPQEDASGADGHTRVTVLAAPDVPSVVLGTVLLTDVVDCAGLTARELVVLGLLVDGCSNQDMARELVIAPRTVATHVEHILHKLGVPTRTCAAVHAEREGCYVPAARLRGWTSSDPGVLT